MNSLPLFEHFPQIEHVTPDCTCPGKICIKCPGLKCYGLFSHNRSKKDKLNSSCKLCDHGYYARMTEEQRAEKIRKNMAYYQEHKQAISERKKRTRIKEVEAQRARDWWAANKENAKMEGHGLTRKQKRIMAEQQEYRCAICGIYIEDLVKLYVDHNHATNQVRELLCHRCNLMLGHAREDKIILLKAVTYLEKWEAAYDWQAIELKPKEETP